MNAGARGDRPHRLNEGRGFALEQLGVVDADALEDSSVVATAEVRISR